MQMITTIRMTAELKAIIDATAAKCNLTVAEVLRAVAHGIRNNRPVNSVVDNEKLKSTTKSGAVVVRVEGGITIPDMMSGYALRRAIFLRCTEELGKPEKRQRRAIQQGVEGVDYNVPDAIAAAKMGIV